MAPKYDGTTGCGKIIATMFRRSYHEILNRSNLSLYHKMTAEVLALKSAIAFLRNSSAKKVMRPSSKRMAVFDKVERAAAFRKLF